MFKPAGRQRRRTRATLGACSAKRVSRYLQVEVERAVFVAVLLVCTLEEGEHAFLDRFADLSCMLRRVDALGELAVFH